VSEATAATLAATAAASAERLAGAGRALDALLAALGAASREDVVRYRLSPEGVAASTSRRVQLGQQEAVLASQAAEAASARVRLDAERPTRFADRDDDALAAAIAACAEAREQAAQVLHQASVKLGVAAEHAAHRAAAADRYASLRERAGPWQQLSQLFGRSDGHDFVVFVQGLYLERLLREANRHLSALNPRYLLQQQREASGAPTLDIRVADRWRAGEPRSFSTLSGGETFQVAMALALGLSELRSSTMPIETLLLDEGFGALDAATLETALAVLGQLQAGGRQVGVISHVAALQERIEARLYIDPVGEGRSQIRPP